MAHLCQGSFTRRALLGAAGMLVAWAYRPRFAFAANGRDVRFVVVVLRGALDGLAAVAPIGDPDYAGCHGDLALRLDGAMPAVPLDSFFALHPAMTTFARLYKAGQAMVVHATATGYRERSHFDGQDVLESGQPAPGKVQSGWLNRLVATLPPGEPVTRKGCLGIGAVAPLIARGPAPIVGWAPPVLPRAGEDLASRLLDLYASRDPALAKALAGGLETERIASTMSSAMRAPGGPDTPEGMRRIAEGTARILAAEDGPRIAALAFEGWDTHAREGGATGQLATRLGGLDSALAAFEEGLRDHWRDTAILVVTEFGRTVHINGTEGTDHGTGTVAFLVGGAVRGGRVLADWPGLKPGQLLGGRDLMPTTDLRGVAKGLLAELFGLSTAVLAHDIFPESGDIAPVRGLVA